MADKNMPEVPPRPIDRVEKVIIYNWKHPERKRELRSLGPVPKRLREKIDAELFPGVLGGMCGKDAMTVVEEKGTGRCGALGYWIEDGNGGAKFTFR